ncbi:capping complex subunit for YIEGIA [Sporosarcina aquimarina]|uniref:Uncharacterized protein n=1 Tax=Sporosarcina aquimarina TaxID=114975 RepID=A0ABU4FUS7_9BACL|nr:hypothetical protein [Sporosarcina aquimarina]MDW0108449.1 hypothetical protein [Sporosarcina aquimarina]
MNSEEIQSGDAPVFIVKGYKELQTIGVTLEKMMEVAAHEIDAESLIIESH